MFKIVTLSLAAIAASASIAAADVSYLLPFDQEQNRDSVVELSTVRAADNGVVEVYSYNAGEIGALLGSEAVSEGANSDVRINIGNHSDVDAIALLKVNGAVVDTQEIEFK